jgi:hypothetical protein
MFGFTVEEIVTQDQPAGSWRCFVPLEQQAASRRGFCPSPDFEYETLCFAAV